MVDGSDNDKTHHLREFFRRLKQVPPAADAEEAMQQIADTLNEVEDELSGIPANPDLWQSDGRMYPPRADNRRSVPGHGDVVRYRARGHNVFVRGNGAMQVREPGEPHEAGRLLLDKPGADGRSVFSPTDGGGRKR